MTDTAIPIACDPHVFTPAERVQELALNVDVILRWPKKKEELPDGYVFHYEGSEDLFLTLARYAANEHRCCPWAAFIVEMDPFAGGKLGNIRLRLKGGAEAKEFLAMGFKYLEDTLGKQDPVSIDYHAVTEDVVRGWEKLQREVAPGKKSLLSKFKTACGC